ncbi:MAG: hypothetical protein HQ517_01385, partial [SAR324 cluster bacterium]|nr:hypothetical protein [SAR324 cluster bacterium]
MSRRAGLLSLHLLEEHCDRLGKNSIEKLIAVLFRVIPEVESEFVQFVELYLLPNKKEEDYHKRYYRETIINKVLTSLIDGDFICKYQPDIVIHLAKKIWFKPDEKSGDRHERFERQNRPEIESRFGFDYKKLFSKFHPYSGLQGPFRSLLSHHPLKGMDFIIDICNHATEH